MTVRWTPAQQRDIVAEYRQTQIPYCPLDHAAEPWALSQNGTMWKRHPATHVANRWTTLSDAYIFMSMLDKGGKVQLTRIS